MLWTPRALSPWRLAPALNIRSEGLRADTCRATASAPPAGPAGPLETPNFARWLRRNAQKPTYVKNWTPKPCCWSKTMKNQSDAGLEARLTAPLEIMLASFAPIGAEGRDLVRRSFSGAPQHQPSGAAIPMDPERNQARLVASGWIARGAMLNDGRRQIIGLSLPGDVIVASGSVDADLLVWALTDVVTVDATAFWTTLSEPGAQASPLSEAWRRCRTAERLRMARRSSGSAGSTPTNARPICCWNCTNGRCVWERRAAAPCTFP